MIISSFDRTGAPLKPSIRPCRTLVITTFILATLISMSCGREEIFQEPVETISLPPSGRIPDDQLVHLTPEQAAEVPIETTIIQPARFSYRLKVPGTVFPAPDYIFKLSAPFNARITDLYAHEGEPVKKGQPLLELESLEFANLVAEYIQARAEVTYQESRKQRLTVLVEKELSPIRDLEEFQVDFIRSTAIARAAQARLLAVGMSASRIEQLEEPTRELNARLEMYAPINGVISEHLIDRGQSVEAYEHMATIINLDKVLVQGYVSPDEAGLLKAGDALTISLKDFPNRKIEGRITTINPALDPINRSVTVNAIINTQNAWPMPGINVRMEIQVQTPDPVITVPLSALTYEGAQALVFLKVDEYTYRKQVISTRRVTSLDAIVESGLKDGEEIAVSQIFTLKALSKMGEGEEE